VVTNLNIPVYSETLEWVKMVEMLVTSSGIQDNTTKFIQVYQALPMEVQQKYKKFLHNPTATSYQDLMTELTNRHQKQNAYMLRKTVNVGQMDPNEGPTEFLRKIREQVADAGIPLTNDQIRQLFLEGLPDNIKAIALSSPDGIDEAAKRANEFWTPEFRTSYEDINYKMENKQLKIELAELTRRLNESTIVTKTEATPKSSRYHVNPIDAIEPEKGSNNWREVRECSQNNYYTPPYMRGTYSRGGSRGGYRGGYHGSRGEDYKLSQNQPHNSRGYQNSAKEFPKPGPNYFEENINKNNRCRKIPTSTHPQGLCFNHIRYGFKAYSCKNPCSWADVRKYGITHHCKNKQHNQPCPWEGYTHQPGN